MSQSPSGRLRRPSSSLTSSIGMRALTRSPVGQRLDGRLLDVVLVVDLADQLLDQVLQGHQPGRAPVLVDDDGLVELLVLHLAHELRDPLGLRHEMGLAA